MLGLVPQDSQQEMMWELMGYCRNDFIAKAIRWGTWSLLWTTSTLQTMQWQTRTSFQAKLS